MMIRPLASNLLYNLTLLLDVLGEYGIIYSKIKKEQTMENEKFEKDDEIEVDAQDVEVQDAEIQDEKATKQNSDENLGFDKEEVREKSKSERVEVEEPKKKNPFSDMSLDTICLILSIAAIAICAFARLFAIISLGIVYAVFAWIGVACLIAALAIYIVQVIKTKKVAFTPNLVILILACLMSI